jgi:hypothetical protein
MSTRRVQRELKAASRRIERKMKDASRAASRRREREMKAAFKRAGRETLRMLLFVAVINRDCLPPELRRISEPSPERIAALEWLRKKDRAANNLARVLFLVTLIAMIAACIAAWPIAEAVIRGGLTK